MGRRARIRKIRPDPARAPAQDQPHPGESPTYAYCCLGVAIQELGDHTWDQSGKNLNLSINACELLAILDHHAKLNSNDLTVLNDDEQLTFTQIAAVIRENTPKPTCDCPSGLSSMGWSQTHQATCKWFKEG